MLLGYARTSTVEQAAGLEAQMRDLKVAGADRLFTEQVSSIGERPEFERAMDYLRDGDALVDTKLDRLARSIRDLVTILDRLAAKQASLRVLNLGLDTGTATGKLVLSMLGAIGEFELQLMKERQLIGIAKAKAEGRYKGRKPDVRARRSEIEALLATGVGATEAAKQLGIARSSVYRVAAGG